MFFLVVLKNFGLSLSKEQHGNYYIFVTNVIKICTQKQFYMVVPIRNSLKEVKVL